MLGVWLLSVGAAIAESVCPSVELTFNGKCYTFQLGGLPASTFSLAGGGFPFLVTGPCFAVKAPTVCSTMDGDASPSPIIGPDGNRGHCVSCGALASATVAALVCETNPTRAFQCCMCSAGSSCDGRAACGDPNPMPFLCALVATHARKMYHTVEIE